MVLFFPFFWGGEPGTTDSRTQEPHPHIAGAKTKKYFVADSTKFSDLPSLVEYYMAHSELFFSNLADARAYHNERLLPVEVVEEVVVS